MRIMVTGLTGSGKTTLARGLAASLGLQYQSGSELRARFLQLAPHADPSGDARVYWMTNAAALEADVARLADNSQERGFDAYLRELYLASSGSVFDVWFLPWLVPLDSGLKLWLEVPRADRVRRICQQDLRSADTELHSLGRQVQDKDERSRQYALEAYGVDIFTDRRPFDIILTPRPPLGSERVTQLVAQVISETGSGLSAGVAPSQSADPELFLRLPASPTPGGN